jgi:hypothetical protein
LKDYQLRQQEGRLKWNPESRTLQLNLNSINIIGKQIDLKQMPLLQSQFSWTVDQ